MPSYTIDHIIVMKLLWAFLCTDSITMWLPRENTVLRNQGDHNVTLCVRVQRFLDPKNRKFNARPGTATYFIQINYNTV